MTVPQSVVDRVNQQPVNQHAKALLQQVGQKVEPSLVHLLQLLQWALASGEVVVCPNFYPSITENVEAMAGWAPQNALAFLLGQTTDEEAVSEAEVLQEGDPVSLAAFLLETLAGTFRSIAPMY
jgi:hypothetical protein